MKGYLTLLAAALLTACHHEEAAPAVKPALTPVKVQRIDTQTVSEQTEYTANIVADAVEMAYHARQPARIASVKHAASERREKARISGVAVAILQIRAVVSALASFRRFSTCFSISRPCRDRRERGRGKIRAFELIAETGLREFLDDRRRLRFFKRQRRRKNDRMSSYVASRHMRLTSRSPGNAPRLVKVPPSGTMRRDSSRSARTLRRDPFIGIVVR